MSSLQQNLLRHIASISGTHPTLEVQSSSSLPLFLRERYKISAIKIFGRRFLLAMEKEKNFPASPSEYARQATFLQTKLKEPVVLVIPALPSYVRNRMAAKGIPFIVPGSQIFLPIALIDLRERFPQPKLTHGKKLTPAAQCVLLYHLQKESLERIALRDIAAKVRYSPIMLTKVKDELEATQICFPFREGRSIMLGFKLRGKELWEFAKPLLSSPVRKKHWVRWNKPAHPALLAGMSALSRHTMIEDDRLSTYALARLPFREALEKRMHQKYMCFEEANVQLESWSYNPLLLRDKKTVDSLSLYLSLQDSTDERVQQQLEILIDKISW